MKFEKLIQANTRFGIYVKKCTQYSMDDEGLKQAKEDLSLDMLLSLNSGIAHRCLTDLYVKAKEDNT